MEICKEYYPNICHLIEPINEYCVNCSDCLYGKELEQIILHKLVKEYLDNLKIKED